MGITDVISKLVVKIFGTSSNRYVKQRRELIEKINALEAEYNQLSDDELKAISDDLRARIAANVEKTIGPDLREVLKEIILLPEEARKPEKIRLTEQLKLCCDAVLPEAFAAVRESSDRHLGIRNVFDATLNFDAATLSEENQTIFASVKQRVQIEGENVHTIAIPPAFYNDVRTLYPAKERSPYRFRHFDVQLIGGNVLYEGNIAEMATGEGKTLMATLAIYLVAISNRKVHVITVNDYLAQRDRDWMAPVFESLGLSVGAIQSSMDSIGDERRAQYGCDITYGTNSEFGFDYLRDNMKTSAEDQVQGPLDFVLIDEVDSILIDDAKTPLIISGPAQDDTERYKRADGIARKIIEKQSAYRKLEITIDGLKKDVANTNGEITEAKAAKDNARMDKATAHLADVEGQLETAKNAQENTTQYYEVEYDKHSVHLTHEGIGAAQDLAGVGSFFVGSNMEWPHLMEQALKAHVVFIREKDYIVQKDEVVIVDENTGRLMVGRQWSDGLHQACEAKEMVTIKKESQTLATITIQNFFKLYQQIAGMTGTAMTEEEEFMNIYGLSVIKVPTNLPLARDDRDDLVFKTEREKFNAIVDEIHKVSKSGQPILIGTNSIEKSEAISAVLDKKYGMTHEVLNAKQHLREATIVEHAGQQHKHHDGTMWGNVTIATNMAGRGTDIKLTKEVIDKGGLYVLGTERNEARRIDNQLRGRSGRQGDVGASQFFLSFDDDLMKYFGGETMLKVLSMVGWEEGEPIQMGRLSNAIGKAQKKVEERNFEQRKSLLEYDEVMNYQRQVFYTRRQSIIEGRNLEIILWDMLDDVIAESTEAMVDKKYPYECAVEWARNTINVDIDLERIRGQKRETLEKTFRTHAFNNAEQEITLTLGEYMIEDVPKEDWDLKSLSSWAMSQFELNISQNQLRNMTPETLQPKLLKAAQARIDRYEFSRLTTFLGEHFGLQGLCDWMSYKFEIDVNIDEIKDKTIEDTTEILKEKARHAYHLREIEYPIDHILNMSLNQQQAGSIFAAVAVANWIKVKFNIELSADEVQMLSFEEIRKKLVDLTNTHLAEGIDKEIAEAFSAHSSHDARIGWANERYHGKLRAEKITTEAQRDAIRAQAVIFLRSELTELEKYILLQIYDQAWKEHLNAMDHLKSGIGLRGFAEKDPKIEYKREGFRMFIDMLSNIRERVTDHIFKIEMDSTERRNVWNIASTAHDQQSGFDQQSAAMAPQGEASKPKQIKLSGPRVGRNEPCPCGSGKKFKKCCG
jgi:preprotein translocase subunit SecA